jgi:hypothetical protein
MSMEAVVHVTNKEPPSATILIGLAYNAIKINIWHF